MSTVDRHEVIGALPDGRTVGSWIDDAVAAIPLQKLQGYAPGPFAPVDNIEIEAIVHARGKLAGKISAQLAKAYSQHASGFPLPSSREQAHQIVDAMANHCNAPGGLIGISGDETIFPEFLLEHAAPVLDPSFRAASAVIGNEAAALSEKEPGLVRRAFNKITGAFQRKPKTEAVEADTTTEMRSVKNAASFFKGEGSEIVDGFKGAFKRAPKIARAIEEAPHSGNLETTIIGATIAAAAASAMLPELGANAVAAAAVDSGVAPLTQQQQAWVQRVAMQEPMLPVEFVNQR